MTRRVGVIVNPIAGMGGRVGLKGTDGPDLLHRALERGAVPVAAERARRALARLAERAPAELEVVEVPTPGSAAQTRAAAAALAAAGVDLILFAGGDGTARDVSAAADSRVPILGIPAGVKMHSACFGATPEAAGEAAAAYLRDPGPHALTEAEIADAAEPADTELRRSAYRSGRQIDAAPDRAPLSTVLHGVALVPRAPGCRLGPKAASAGGGDGALEAACARVAAEVDPAALTLFGPGTTTARIERALGLEPSLRGVDAARDGRLVARDATEAELLALLAGATAGAGATAETPAAPGAPPAAHLVLGVVGGQGSLLGRGNQPLSPAVLRRVDRSRITVVADRRKLLALDPPQLRVDTGDPDLDHDLSGHVRVRVAARETLMCAVTS
ncbi:ATP-NAD kinase family protein [Conexibacter arvalis]|uniref:Putative polyphosphate/ATP-dependent NAD kinase n=1 Tax=Conexibacter arvalis TaxID=912552 RepID=A0A840IAH0_9ACTN|nr:NAD(+)/NADH kinase [Conexibacter arvalis]MBB4661355.1 putative polyphosphate/ATP-dependent NAD kinase [Conexibacter arvalis]